MICCMCLAGHHHMHTFIPCDCTNPEHAVALLAAQVKSLDNKKATRRRARKNDPDTSKHAAKTMTSAANVQQKRIYNELLLLNGTFHELAARTGLRPDQVHKRLPELATLKMAEATDEERPGPSGRPCRVWRALINYIYRG